MDLSDDKLRKEKRKQFLEREIHLKEIINAITVKHRLKSINDSIGYTRHRSYLDYLPGVVAYINAGYDKNAMGINDENVRALIVRNFEIIAIATKPFYDVALVLQQSAERIELYQIPYPFYRLDFTTVEALGRFIRTAPGHFHALDPEDMHEVNRKLAALQSIYEDVRFDVSQ